MACSLAPQSQCLLTQNSARLAGKSRQGALRELPQHPAKLPLPSRSRQHRAPRASHGPFSDLPLSSSSPSFPPHSALQPPNMLVSASMSPMSPSLSRFDIDPASIMLQQRMIFLGSQVDDLSADWVISQLLLLDAQDPAKDITLLINSPGGSVTAGMGIYDAMKLCRADISTVCFGLAASMGAFLLAAGSKGKRYAMPNARIMIHQPLGGAQGSAIDVGLQVREMMYHKVKLNKILSRATGQTEAKIEEDTDRDNFMSAWQAVEYGLIDGVVGGDKPELLIAPEGEAKEPPKTKISDLWTVKVGKERRRLPGEQNLLKTEA